MLSLFSFKSVGGKRKKSPSNIIFYVEFVFFQKCVWGGRKEPVFCVRYLSVAVIANKRRRSNNMMKELVKIIEQESYAYRDPITDFVSCLYIDYDFHSAQKKLKVGRVGLRKTAPQTPHSL